MSEATETTGAMSAKQLDAYIDMKIDELFVPRGAQADPSGAAGAADAASDPEPENPVLSPLRESLLSLDWEISAANIQAVENSLQALGGDFSGDLHASSVLKMSEVVCKYLRASQGLASPLSIQFLHSTVRSLELLLQAPPLPKTERNALVERLLEKYKQLKADAIRMKSSGDDRAGTLPQTEGPQAQAAPSDEVLATVVEQPEPPAADDPLGVASEEEADHREVAELLQPEEAEELEVLEPLTEDPGVDVIGAGDGWGEAPAAAPETPLPSQDPEAEALELAVLEEPPAPADEDGGAPEWGRDGAEEPGLPLEPTSLDSGWGEDPTPAAQEPVAADPAWDAKAPVEEEAPSPHSEEAYAAGDGEEDVAPLELAADWEITPTDEPEAGPGAEEDFALRPEPACEPLDAAEPAAAEAAEETLEDEGCVASSETGEDPWAAYTPSLSGAPAPGLEGEAEATDSAAPEEEAAAPMTDERSEWLETAAVEPLEMGADADGRAELAPSSAPDAQDADEPAGLAAEFGDESAGCEADLDTYSAADSVPWEPEAETTPSATPEADSSDAEADEGSTGFAAGAADTEECWEAAPATADDGQAWDETPEPTEDWGTAEADMDGAGDAQADDHPLQRLLDEVIYAIASYGELGDLRTRLQQARSELQERPPARADAAPIAVAPAPTAAHPEALDRWLEAVQQSARDLTRVTGQLESHIAALADAARPASPEAPLPEALAAETAPASEETAAGDPAPYPDEELCATAVAGQPYAVPAALVANTFAVPAKRAASLQERGYATLADFKRPFRSVTHGLAGALADRPKKDLRDLQFPVVNPEAAGGGERRGVVLLSDGQRHAALFTDVPLDRTPALLSDTVPVVRP